MSDRIHPQLLADCHNMGSLATSQLLLHRNAELPWFILVPDVAVDDLLDLAGDHRDRIMADCASVSGFIKQALGFAKVNFASLGNVVPQMHLHVVGRRQDDPCWPHPVWGNLPPGAQYDYRQLLVWQADLRRVMDLVPAELPQ